MEITLNGIIVILLVVMMFIAYQTFSGVLNLIRYKGTKEYQRWRKRSGKLNLIDSIERAVAVFLVITTVIIVTLLIIWGKNQ